MKLLRLVIGLPSYNEAATIGSVVRVLDAGVAALPHVDAVICNADSASDDGTPDRFHSTPTATPKVSIPAPADHRGKGRNVLAILEMAASAEAACVLFDTDVTSITAEWLTTYVAALSRRFDYVVPTYRRAKHAATVTNTSVYPLVRGVLGADIRQPIGGDFGLSPVFVKTVLECRGMLDPAVDIGGFGIDAYLTCTALEKGVAICGARLGPKTHRVKNPAHDLRAVFADEMLVVFDCIVRNAERLGAFRPELSMIGNERREPVPHPGVDCADLGETARALHRSGDQKMRAFFAEHLLRRTDAMFDADARPRLSNTDWISLLFDAIVAFEALREWTDVTERKLHLRALMALLYPFYLARVIDLVSETDRLDDDAAECVIRRYADEVTARRGELVERLLPWTAVTPSVG